MGRTYIPFVNLTCGPHRLSGPHVSLTMGIIRSAYTRVIYLFILSCNLWHPLIIIVFYYQTKTSISFGVGGD